MRHPLYTCKHNLQAAIDKEDCRSRNPSFSKIKDFDALFIHIVFLVWFCTKTQSSVPVIALAGLRPTGTCLCRCHLCNPGTAPDSPLKPVRFFPNRLNDSQSGRRNPRQNRNLHRTRGYLHQPPAETTLAGFEPLGYCFQC